jgi:hypothetical protein
MRSVRWALLVAAAAVLGLSAGPAHAATFSTPGQITLTHGPPASPYADTPATPYPSTIIVSGQGGFVTKATVTLFGLSETKPQGIDMVLVGSPSSGGNAVVLMSDACNAVGGGVSDLTLTFDDAAGADLPLNDGGCISGSYRPTDYTAAASDSHVPGTAGLPGKLSNFNGANPNGPWQLYVADQSAESIGAIARGWSLTLDGVRPKKKCRRKAAHKKSVSAAKKKRCKKRRRKSAQ